MKTAKDVQQSEEILRIKDLVIEGFDFMPKFKTAKCSQEAVEPFLTAVHHRIARDDPLQVRSDSRKEPDYVTSFVVAKVKEKFGTCWKHYLKKNYLLQLKRTYASCNEEVFNYHLHQ